MGEEIRNTEFPYCKLMTDEDLPKLTLTDFKLLVNLINTEKYTNETLDKRKEIYKKILELCCVPESEAKNRIELAEAFLHFWIKGYGNNKKQIPDKYQLHIKNNFQTIFTF
jgi:hypothetical protein